MEDELMIQHWLYYYERVDGDRVSWKPVRQLDDATYAAVKEALLTVTRSMEGVGAFAHLALADLDSYVSALQAKEDAELRETVHAWSLELRYRVVAVSSAVRMYDEAVRTAAANDDEKTAVARALAAVYDSSLAYRTLAAYRNSVVHGGRSLDRAWAKAKLVEVDGREQRATEVAMWLRRDSTKSANWKATLRADLNALDADPDLVELSRQAVAAVDQHRPILESVAHPNLPAAIEYLRPLFVEFLQWKQPPRLHNHVAGDPFTSLTMDHISYAMGEYVLNWRPQA